MLKNLGSRFVKNQVEVPVIYKIWALRMLLYIIPARKIMERLDFLDDPTIECLLPLENDDEEKSQENQIKTIKTLKMHLTKLQRPQRITVNRKTNLLSNIDVLGVRLGMNNTERLLLAFAVAINGVEIIREVGRVSELGGQNNIERSLAIVLNVSEVEIMESLKSTGILAISGVLKYRFADSIETSLEILYGLPALLLKENLTEEDMLDHFLERAPGSSLEAADFSHLKNDTDFLRRLLTEALSRRTRGINILVHGPSGCGKTEWIRFLATHMQQNLFQVRSQDEDGSPENDRISHFVLCQRFLTNNGDCLMMLDEIEDVFPVEDMSLLAFGRRERRSPRKKLWINQLLESNPVPAIWIGNEVQHIDPAILRRFTYIIELREPPREVRRRMLMQGMAGMCVSAAWMERMVGMETLTPANIRQAALVVDLVQAGEGEVESFAEKVIHNVLRATGQVANIPVETSATLSYDLSLLNTNVPLDTLVGRLSRVSSARLCLSGPPGTGKTAFANYLAKTLGRPLLVRRGADILGMYVGETEKNLAAMFTRAEREGAILFLDEADSFLYSRQRAVQRWEVTQVNELLTRMESYQGLFLCATNDLDVFDPAALRRFDIKIHFDCLRMEQRVALFQQIVRDIGLMEPPGKDHRPRLRRLDRLTVGDFRTAVRQIQIMADSPGAEALLGILEQECALKPGASMAIGFSV